jgi:ppGpp synthetase/RelA/SpoT-type nucleotidyltranferase
MQARVVEDYLREEYSLLLPGARRAAAELETQVRHLLLPVTRSLAGHEQVVVKARVKDCESAIGSLKRRIEFASFEKDAGAVAPSLTTLNDLVGVRILAFPKCRVIEIDAALRYRFPAWTPDPIPPLPGGANSLALKYHGYLSEDCCVRAEIQLMSMLMGLFWEVEHAALYKPGERLRGTGIALKMQPRYADVINALDTFEAEFETLAGKPAPEDDSVS